MALTLTLNQVTGLSSRGDKLARISFRGVSQYTKTIENASDDVIFDEVFTWPVGRPIERHETLDIHLLTYSKYLNNRVLGRYGLVLQHLIEDLQLQITDSLVDNNNMPMKAQVSFELIYSAPDGSIGSWQVTDTDFTCDHDDQKALLDIEQNIASIERRLSEKENHTSSATGKNESSRDTSQRRPRGSLLSNRSLERKRSATRKTIASVMKLGKQRPPVDNEEKLSLKDAEQCIEYGSFGNLERHPSDVTMAPRPSIDENMSHHANSGDDEPTPPKKSTFGRRKLKWQPSDIPAELKAQDFQVCITIIEARQLAGLNMDPVVCIQVGDQKKHTSVKESTNCPYYNEYFVFDFQMPPAMLFDKIITLSVLYSRNIIRSGKVLGCFKLDVGTAWLQPDRQFYHKWALLTDPEDPVGVPKGYLKCDISVIGKGDTVKIPQKSEKDEDDIEENLLIPDGFPAERQRARFIIRIYRADGLPRMNAGIVANVKKAFTGEAQDLVDPYVQVSFAGFTGKTSVKKNCYQPVWNEQIVFTEMFPPLCQRIKIQLRDNDSVNDTVIGTHFIELARISNEGEKGFLPTFGPAFVHLYGSTRDFSIFDEHTNLNEGLGEGVSYRGRILIALKTEILDSQEMGCPEVEVEATMPIIESTYGRQEDFFLFATIMESDMIDRRIGDKPIYFEISIGNAGNALDGVGEIRVTKESDEEGAEEAGALEAVTSEGPRWQSTTVPMRPISQDRVFFSVPYGDSKPCVYVYSTWQDHRRRLHNSNIIAKVADRLEENLCEVQYMVQQENSSAEKQLRISLEELASGCSRYLSVVKGGGSSSSGVKTKLDKERQRLCQRELDHIGNLARSMLPVLNKKNVKDKIKMTQNILQKLRFLTEDPQHSLPNVFLWMISGGKRVAYHRMSARDLLYSIVEEESGKDSGLLKTIFLKHQQTEVFHNCYAFMVYYLHGPGGQLPGKKGTGQPGWTVQAKVRAYFWLGLAKHKKNCLKGLPKGYDHTTDVKNIDKPLLPPPTTLRYRERYEFQLRAHMYEARSLIASDASGLSDPFARVIVGDQSATTQVIDETLSPTWDEMLVFHDLVVYGNKDHIRENPPPVVIEIYDQDKVGKAEFMGRVVAKPHVKTDDEPYAKPLFPPCLEWFELYRGCDSAGELLAAFELLEMSSSADDVPMFPEPKGNAFLTDRGPCLPVPQGIRPVLSSHRIEILFWGLRDLKRVHLMSVNRPRVDIDCAGRILQSSVIQNYKKNPNFNIPVKYFVVELPEEAIYCPSLTIRVVDCRSFGRYTLVGTHIMNTLFKFLYTPFTKRERESLDRKKSMMQLAGMDHNEMAAALGPNASNVLNNNGNSIPVDTVIPLECVMTNAKDQKTDANKKKKAEISDENDDEENKDWWTKYFASVELMIEERREAREAQNNKDNAQQNGSLPNSETDSKKGGDKESKKGDHTEKKRTFRGAATAARIAARLSPKSQRRKPIKKQALMKIYPNELEMQLEFGGFREWLHTFELYRGKKTGDDADDESRIVGKFKGSLKVYKIPLPADIEDQTILGGDPQYGLFHGLPNNDPIHVLVRIYVVKANDLHPMDINGKADPYLVIALGSKKIVDKDNYISKQLNPVFGKCFEFEATFPHDSMLSVQIYDWDLVGSDDLIGETKIDLENRFYSRHRATCGLGLRYETTGYNQWRDPMKPTQILGKLCKDKHVGGPHYLGNGVRIGNKTFTVQHRADGECLRISEEHLALAVLNRWQEIPKVGAKLVPEHVETRPLYNPSKPGIEQGKVEMWVDMFPMDMPLPGGPIDISPRKPTSYELRVIIWNTDEVVLEDDAFFSGEKMSDIYVKGWLKGSEDTQTTDIHYRSLTGEGNFNWRYIFPFDYLVAEEKIVISRKESMFSWDETESKIPARLVLQVWDADHFSADDFLGSITLDLNRFPRGAKSSKLCTLNMLRTDGSVPMVSLFKQRRVKGWWPFYVKKENDDMELTGKVEAELHLITCEEAEKSPAGLGRNEPDPLEKPNRPDSSFIWFLNPLKSIRYIVWHSYKWVIIKAILLLLLFGIFILFFYAVPGYTVKKMLGA